MKLIDLTGSRFGWLSVMEKAPNRGDQTYWLCKCDCGNTTEVNARDLKNGHTKSCGCNRLTNANIAKTTHGKTKGSRKSKDRVPRIYNTWCNMKQRCGNPNNPAYYRYGGRGIKVCTEWEKDFMAFRDWAMRNGYSDTLTIDRIDGDGDYEPGNCQWVTLSENARRQGKKRYKRRTA